MKAKIKNRISFFGYHLLALVFIIFTLNDSRVINLYESGGYLKGLSDVTFNIVNSVRYAKSPSSEDIQIILTDDMDISQFPSQGDAHLNNIYEKIIRESKGYNYIDPETGEAEFIEYEEVRDEFCSMMHADASASRYGIVTALNNILSQKTPPKLVLLDYIYLGVSSRCPEYDDALRDIIKTHPEVIVIASGVNEDTVANTFINTDPSLYIRSSKKQGKPTTSKIHDSIIYPYFKDIYRENKELNNMGLGNVIVEAPVVMEGRFYIETKNYKVPTVSAIIARYLKKEEPKDEKVSINWRKDLYKHKSISSIIMPINEDDIKTSPIVVFGSNLTGKSADKMYTPIMDLPTPGVYVQATIIDNIINEDFVKRSPPVVSILLSVMIILLVHLTYFGIVVNLMPKNFFLSRFYRSHLVSNMQDYFSREFMGLKLFIVYELIGLFLSGLILYSFDYYIDVVTPIVIGSSFWTLMKVIHYFIMRALITNHGLMKELEQSNYNMYFIKHPGDFKTKKDRNVFLKDINIYFEKNISVVEFSPFNRSGIFGFKVISKYYWWVSKRSMDVGSVSSLYQVHKIKCHSDVESMSSEFRKKMSTFWNE